MERKHDAASRAIRIAVLTVLLLAGGIYTWQEIRIAERQMRIELLARTRLMAEAVNPESVKKLSGTAADLGKPEYLRIKKQLTLLKQDNADIRFIYLMGYRPDGTIFFFADNEPPDSPDYSPPGQPYTEGTPGFQEAMRRGDEIVEGPTSDQWGIWMSASVPVKDLRTGRALTCLGVDVAAGVWRETLFMSGLPGAGLTLLLTGIAGAWMWLARRRRYAESAPRWMEHLGIFGIVAAGSVISLFAAWRVQVEESAARNRIFQQLAASETAQIAQIVGGIRSTELEGFAAFFLHNAAVHRNEFFHYSQYLTRNPMVRGWLWAPAVPAAEATAFETRIRRNEDPGYRIRPESAAGGPPATTKNGRFFPILYAEPRKSNANVIGFNLIFEPERRAAVEAALESGMPTATNPVRLFDSPDQERVIEVFRPVFSPERKDTPLGIAAVVLPISSIRNRSRIHKDLVDIDFSILQGGDRKKPLSLFGGTAYGHAGSGLRRYFFAFGKVFCLTARPGTGFIRAYPLWKHIVVLFAGLVFTAALALIATLISRRRSELERLVRERTEELGESEFRFRQLCRHSRTLVWDIDEQGRFTYVNDVSEILLGYRPEEMVGRMRFQDLHPASFRRMSGPPLPAFPEGEEPLRNIETRLETKDGRQIWISFHGMPLFKADGSPAGFRGECIDVTTRKTAEDEKGRQIEFQKMLNRIAATYINLPPDRIEEAINHSLAEFGAFLDVDRFYVFEFDAEGQSCTNTCEWCAPGIVPQIDQFRNIPLADIARWMNAVRRNGIIHIPDVKQLPPEDETRKMLESRNIRSRLCVPLMEGERCMGVVGFDSIRKNHASTDEEVRLLHVFAQMLVNVHAKCRAEAALRHSRKQAEEASRAKSEFLTNISHEIRTPINGVIGVAELLRDTRLDSVQRNLLEIINSSGKLLLELVNDILDFSRIEAGKIELRPVDFDLDELLEGVTGGLALCAHARNVELAVAVSPEVPAYLRGDSLRLRQVLMNLAGNAVKFTDRGEIVLAVSVESETGDSVVVRFSVRDTGIGVEQSQQAFLFDPFYQADSSVKRRYGGTGLGLPITRALVDRMKGELRFTSEAGVGSEFSFTVPLIRTEAKEATLLPASEWRQTRILVADDNAAVREALMRELATHSPHPAGTADGAAVPGLLREARTAGKPFGAVLIDWEISGADTPALMEEIRKEAALAGSALIALVPLGSRLESGQPAAAGFCRTLNKPINRKELRALLQLSPAAVSTPDAAASGESPRPSPMQETAEADLLLAEDNTVNQKVMQLLLKKLGMRADIAGNGIEALQKLAEKNYRLVLMDVQMPELDGLEATRRIRDPASPVRNHRIPVIAVTAHALEGYLNTCRAAGMDDYITKPVTPDQLREVLERWLGPAAP